MHNAFGKLLTRGMTECSLQTSQASTAADCGVQLWLHQRQLRKSAVGRSNMEPGLWPVAPDEFKSGGDPSGAKRRKKFFVTVSTVWQVCCLQFTVPFGVGATVCGYALGGSDKSLTLVALTRLFGSGLPHTLVLCFSPLSPNLFVKTHRICINLKTGPGAGWGWGGQLPPFAPPVTTLMYMA